MFFAYNNGVSATAMDVQLERTASGTHIVGARDFQIINGGQTTASLSNTRHKDKADLEGIYVQMKLTEIDESDMDRSTELVRNISRSSNSQNKVTDADFFSTHPFHIRMERFDLTGLRCYRNLKQAKRLERSLGTLGGGNHFIEIDAASDGTKYLVIHSGSRNLGKQVAELYQSLAIDLNAGKADYFERRDELIRTYKEQGRRAEIQTALKAMEKEWAAKEPTIPADLCYLYGTYLEDYLHDVEICQQFARRSRERMAEIILEKTGMTAISYFHTIHNYIDTKEMILRKGSIAAHDGELVLIPINMRDGSVLARGKGNPEWNYSAPHGAGRLMSRTKARETLDLEAYRKTMEGIYTTSVNEATIDEAPMAYKSLKDIIDVIRESVDVIEILKPIYNFKASE